MPVSVTMPRLGESVSDIVNRTHVAQDQTQCLLAAELVIKADQRLKYGDVKEVFKMTKDAGFQDVGLIAEKKQKPG